MSKVVRTLNRVLRGTADANIRFADLCRLLLRLGFDQRVRGDHHIFTREDIEEILNRQPRGSQAKAYQVKQVRSAIVAHALADELESDATDELIEDTSQIDEETDNEEGHSLRNYPPLE